MSNQGITGIRRILMTFVYSGKGLKESFVNEEAFRLEILLCVIFIPLGLLLGSDVIEQALLTGSLFIILIIELLNTGLEAIVDLISTEQNHLSGYAKDAGSAAVLLSFINAIMIWCIILI